MDAVMHRHDASPDSRLRFPSLSLAGLAGTSFKHEHLDAILADGPSVENRREFASRVGGDLAIARACDLIEELGLLRRRPQSQ